jgi:hypothetical protein
LLNLALFLRAMSALSYTVISRVNVVKLPCVRLIVVGGMLSEVFRGHGHVYTDSYFAGERYVVKLPCVRLVIAGGMFSEVFWGR